MKEIADMAEQCALSEYDGEPLALDELGKRGWLPCTDSQVLEQMEVIAPGVAA